MRIPRSLWAILMLVLAWSLAGCEANIDFRGQGGTKITSTRTVFGPPGGLPPPPGRTAEERAARRDYYRGPRGAEF